MFSKLLWKRYLDSNLALAESHDFIFYKLELGVIANIESWENDFEYEYGLKSFSYSYSLLMLTSSIKVSSTTAWRNVTNKGWKALKRKRRCTLHAVVSKEFANFIVKDDRPANARDVNHVDYRWRDKIQRSSPQNTGRANTVTTLRLEKWHTLGARTFYTSSLRKCQKKIKENILVTNISLV